MKRVMILIIEPIGSYRLAGKIRAKTDQSVFDLGLNIRREAQSDLGRTGRDRQTPWCVHADSSFLSSTLNLDLDGAP